MYKLKFNFSNNTSRIVTFTPSQFYAFLKDAQPVFIDAVDMGLVDVLAADCTI